MWVEPEGIPMDQKPDRDLVLGPGDAQKLGWGASTARLDTLQAAKA